MNKRQIAFIIATIIVVLTAVIVTAHHSLQQAPENNKLNVVATFYPLAFFAQQIGGVQIVVEQLVPDNTEVHNWQPSLIDILALEDADIILYNGATLDHWFEDDILPAIHTADKLIVKTTEGIELLEAENSKNEGENKILFDPHTWISPAIAKQQAQSIYQALIYEDPDNKDYYAGNWQNLKNRLEELDNKYLDRLSAKNKQDIFVSHSAFGYLAYRYNFEQHGVIGISADEQPSVAVYANLVDLMVEHESYVVYVDPVYPGQSAQTLKNELERLSGETVEILELYFMLGKMDNLDYFGQQEQNLENLKIGLEA